MKFFEKRWLAVILTLIVIFSFSVPVIGIQEDEESDFYKARASLTFEDMKGKIAGVLEGSIQDEVVARMVDDVTFGYYKSMADELLALQQKKVDYLLLIDEQYRTVMDIYPDLCSLPSTYVECGECGFMFNKDKKNQKLYDEMNEFIIDMKDSGGMQELEDYWFSPGEKTMEPAPETGENGVITIATAASVPPFEFVQDEEIIGFEVDVLSHFCEKYGYGLDITIYDVTGTLATVQSGKVDIAINCIAKTPERMEVMSATETVVIPHYSFIVRKETVTELTGVEPEDESGEVSFADKIKESFKKTFIYENRGKMVWQGTAVTIEITFFAAILGIILGYLLYLLRKSKSAAGKNFVFVYNSIMSGTPILVLLMVFFYIIFGQSKIDPFWVACIVFGMNFGSVMSELYYSCFESINKGQVEAALALGFSEKQAFRKFVLPQALTQILPLAKGQLVALLKSTSVVGYVAIIDLTKAGDLIRSKTFEAFFPLISIAVIYFVMAWIIRVVIGKIEFKTDRVKQRDLALARAEKAKSDAESIQNNRVQSESTGEEVE